MKRFLLFVAIIQASTSWAQILPGKDCSCLLKDGAPFFWLGDTDWEMAHRLTREEVKQVIDTRAQQGFNVLQVVALAEMNGIREPNRYGDYPLNMEDPVQFLETPGQNPENPYEYDYWDHLDFIIDYAATRGIYIGLLPTWGDKLAHMWGEGPLIFNESNVTAYGHKLATRYRNNKNVLWILGGDRPAIYQWKIGQETQNFDDRALWRAMANGIEAVLGPQTFITYHTAGGSFRTTSFFLNEPWLDMHSFQSGHGARETEAWNWVKEDLRLAPLKPTLDMEPCYEDHPVNPWDGKWTRQRGYFSAYDVRARIYRSVFAGACGVTYGHHSVWQFLNKDLYPPINVGDTLIGWQRALTAEAAGQMKHLKNLMLSRSTCCRVSGQAMILSSVGNTYLDQRVATLENNGAFAMIYLPQNTPIKVDLSLVSGKVKKVWWFNVRTGSASEVGLFKQRSKVFSPPEGGSDSRVTDWVLVIDDASRKFLPPGTLAGNN